MSVVEKSIAKMRSSGAVPLTAFDARTEVVGSIEEVTAEIALLGLPNAAAEVGRFVRIDRLRLRRAGFVPDESQERRFADQYRRIKRPILMQVQVLTAAHAPGARFVLMASALPGDGKTFTSINLALSIARERDVSVLIMDADVAKPHISRIFGIDQEPGLLDALADDEIDIESLVLPTDVPGLSMLSAGHRHEAATELLASARMNQVITRLMVRDPPRQAVQEAIGYIGEGKPLGLVLNQSLLALSEGYYGYGSYGDTPSPTA